ncbi:MAG: hypothetical protein ABI867_24160 [Kofleriaceae bacterium]
MKRPTRIALIVAALVSLAAACDRIVELTPDLDARDPNDSAFSPDASEADAAPPDANVDAAPDAI